MMRKPLLLLQREGTFQKQKVFIWAQEEPKKFEVEIPKHFHYVMVM